MNFKEFLNIVPKIKNIPLPAESSQFKMMPANRMEQMDQYKEAMKQAKQSAVLALFYPDHSQKTKFALIQRKAYNGVHSSQIHLKLVFLEGSLRITTLTLNLPLKEKHMRK